MGTYIITEAYERIKKLTDARRTRESRMTTLKDIEAASWLDRSKTRLFEQWREERGLDPLDCSMSVEGMRHIEQLEHALAEKDLVIKQLSETTDRQEQRIAKLLKTQENQARELERVRGENEKLLLHMSEAKAVMDKEQKQYNDLLRTAVQMAKGCLGRGDEWHWPAVEFLATPAATALQQAKGDHYHQAVVEPAERLLKVLEEKQQAKEET